MDALKVIARLRCDFPTKFGLPRQSGLNDALKGKIVFEPAYRNPDAVRGIEAYSHLWLIWGFSVPERENWSATVRPSRLGGNERVGVFATRSPFRPNPLQVVVTEILPYALTWSLSNFMNATLSAIASESSLAVLGLSPANLISLGNMIQWARDYNAIFARQWFWIGSPIVATVILFIGLFMLITGYNDYLSKKRGR